MGKGGRRAWGAGEAAERGRGAREGGDGGTRGDGEEAGESKQGVLGEGWRV